MASGEYEVLAAHLLLCAPTDLNRAWANSEDDEIETNVRKELAYLGLSKPSEEAVVQFAQVFAVSRNVFKGVGDTTKAGLYSGSEPHPTRDQARAIIAKLREIT